MARRRKAASKANKAPPAAVVTPEPAGKSLKLMDEGWISHDVLARNAIVIFVFFYQNGSL